MIAACMLKCTWSSCADFVLCVLDGIDLESSCRYRTSSLGRQNKQPCHSGVGVCLLSDFYDFPFPCGIQWGPRLQRWIEMGVDSFVFWSSGSRIRVFLLRLLAEDLENACTRLTTQLCFLPGCAAAVTLFPCQSSHLSPGLQGVCFFFMLLGG